MRRILVSSSNEEKLRPIKQSIELLLGNDIDNFIIDYTFSCDDAFQKIREAIGDKSYNSFIFDPEHCEYYQGLLAETNKFNNSVRYSIERFTHLSNHESVKIDEKQKNHILINKNIIDFSTQYILKDDARRIFNLICYLPTFYFSYGNDNFSDGIGGHAKDILNEVEQCVSKLFPFIKPKKDYQDFKKGEMLDEHTSRLVNSSYIFMIINEKFLYSPHCMEELHKIGQRMDFNAKIFNDYSFLITSDIAEKHINSHDPDCQYEALKDHWINQLKKKVDNYIQSGCRDAKGVENIINILNITEKALPFIRDGVSGIIRKQFKAIKNEGYFSLLMEINHKLKNNGYPDFYPDAKEEEIIKVTKGVIKYQNIDEI